MKLKFSETEYLYASARIKALETGGITRERYNKMLDSKTVGEAEAVLHECDYGGLADISNGYESLFAAEQLYVYELIGSIIPDKNIITYFRYFNDCHNIKSILKSEINGTDPDVLLSEAGTVPVKDLKNIIRDRTMSGLPENMASAFFEASEIYAQTRDPMLIDIIIDRACFRDLASIVSEIGSEFLSEMFSLRADMINIMSAIRQIRMKSGSDLFRSSLVEGGKLPEELFISAFEAGEAQLYESLRYTSYSKITDFAAGSTEKSSLGALEKLCDEIYLEHVQSVRYIPYGEAVAAGYIAGKEAEIRNARIIISGKAAGLSSDVIKERLRAVYV